MTHRWPVLVVLLSTGLGMTVPTLAQVAAPA